MNYTFYWQIVSAQNHVSFTLTTIIYLSLNFNIIYIHYSDALDTCCTHYADFPTFLLGTTDFDPVKNNYTIHDYCGAEFISSRRQRNRRSLYITVAACAFKNASSRPNPPEQHAHLIVDPGSPPIG